MKLVTIAISILLFTLLCSLVSDGMYCQNHHKLQQKTLLLWINIRDGKHVLYRNMAFLCFLGFVFVSFYPRLALHRRIVSNAGWVNLITHVGEGKEQTLCICDYHIWNFSVHCLFSNLIRWGFPSVSHKQDENQSSVGVINKLALGHKTAAKPGSNLETRWFIALVIDSFLILPKSFLPSASLPSPHRLLSPFIYPPGTG